MRQGYILIEILIATALASIMSVMLLTSVFQMNRSYARVDAWSNLYFRAVTVQHQLERDLMGVFMLPREPEKKQGREEKDTAAAEKERKARYKMFHGHDKDGMLDFISIITTSRLISYWLPKGRVPPRAVRVIYWLIPEKNKERSYRLLRTQTRNLDLPIKELRPKEEQEHESGAIEVARGIKECTLTYVWRVQEPEKKQAQHDGKQEKKEEKAVKKERPYRHSTHWPPREKVPEKEGTIPSLPERVDLKLVLWERQQERAYPFYQSIPIYAQHELKPEQEQQQPARQGAAVPQGAAPKKQEQADGEEQEQDLFAWVFGAPRDNFS